MLTSLLLTPYLPLPLTDTTDVFVEYDLHRGPEETCHFMTNLTSEDHLSFENSLISLKLKPNDNHRLEKQQSSQTTKYGDLYTVYYTIYSREGLFSYSR